MRYVLETLLAREEIACYPSLKELAQWIGCSDDTLRRHCPDLCRASVKRYKRQRADDSARFQMRDDSTRLQMREALESALARSDPVSLMAVARHVGCSPETLRKYFPELCQAVVARYRGRFDGQRVQKRLQEVLASDEDVPSMSELAGQLGYDVTLIWNHFTNLCKGISARYRDQKHKRREEQMKTVCEEIRQVVLLLHNQGIYPSAKRVSFLLKNRHSVRTFEGHEAWRLALAELGYPTDAIKRYGLS
jgi:AraC-like DNA-binding protein